MKEIVLIGGGGHCKSVIDVIEKESRFKIVGIIDDDKNKLGKIICGYKIIGDNKILKELRQKFEYALVTVGQIKTPKIRIKLFNLLKELDFKLPTIISPLAYASKHSFIDEGTVVMHHALINADAKVGKNCIINSKALIEHDVIIEDNCHISTGACINGGVRVLENSFIGSNAVTIEYIEIKSGSFIKAGSLVK